VTSRSRALCSRDSRGITDELLPFRGEPCLGKPSFVRHGTVITPNRPKSSGFHLEPQDVQQERGRVFAALEKYQMVFCRP
jgi:hypothetical protein